MIFAGIILVVLQVIAVIGSLIAGGNPFAGGLFGTIGYFLFGIIGVILIIVGISRKNKNSANEQEINNTNTQDEINKAATEDKTSSANKAEQPTPFKNTSNYPKKSIYGKREFELWLIDMGYKEYTDDGKPSTVYHYSKSINMIVEIELLSSWKDLEENIDLYIKQYDTGGTKEKIGNWSNRTVINALKRYKEFLIYN